jgi:beta-glucanase (GH16 family)
MRTLCSGVVRRARMSGAVLALSVSGGVGCSSDVLGPTTAADRVIRFAAVMAAGSEFTDDFDAFDETRWYKSHHILGRGPLRPENVVVEGGSAHLVTRSSGFEGAEIMSLATYGLGTFSARARCAAPAGTICAFFLYQTGVGDRADEIDIEILGATREIMFTLWVKGRRTAHARKLLSFDPATSFNTYTIQRSTNEVKFFVNGVVMQSFKGRNKVPQASMPLFANSWWPTWLTPATGDGTWELDQVTAW